MTCREVVAGGQGFGQCPMRECPSAPASLFVRRVGGDPRRGSPGYPPEDHPHRVVPVGSRTGARSPFGTAHTMSRVPPFLPLATLGRVERA